MECNTPLQTQPLTSQSSTGPPPQFTITTPMATQNSIFGQSPFMSFTQSQQIIPGSITQPPPLPQPMRIEDVDARPGSTTIYTKRR